MKRLLLVVSLLLLFSIAYFANLNPPSITIIKTIVATTIILVVLVYLIKDNPKQK